MADINAKKKKESRIKRHRRVRARVSGIAEKPRLSVFRSLKHFYAQLIDDTTGKTLVAVSEKDIDVKKVAKGEGERKGKVAVAYALGKIMAEKAQKNGISVIVFDRGGFNYTGRVAAFADGAREGGLEF